MIQEAEEILQDEASTTGLQHTIAKPALVRGPGLLYGEEAELVIEPAPADHGIVFERVDLDPPVRIPALIDHAVDRARRTTLKSGSNTIDTVEHFMSALAGLGIDNALVRLNGPEVPLGDGSAIPFVDAIQAAGTQQQDASRLIYEVTEPIILEEGGSMLAAFPSRHDDFRVIYELDYGTAEHRIARQSQGFVLNTDQYLSELAEARTYSLKEEAQGLWEKGLCRHLTPKDVLVIGDDGPIENAYRFDNEPARHKILDMIGDLYLLGGPVHGRFVASRSGHDLNRKMCTKIREQAEARRRQDMLRDGRVMDIRAIQQIMPHRYPMLLVDRVIEVEGHRRAIGVKNVTINEPFFGGHYPSTPIMPGVLIVEAMAQLGGLLLSQKLEHAGKIAVLLSLDKVKLRHPVTPGDQLVLEAETVRASARTASIQCQAFVGSQLAAEAAIRFMMVDAEQS
ncbi:MAG: 3-hydroxyacyl-[acyl-carrier-protein] dehydratase FabZ [Phycisphaerae bacterium]|nr:3-hydroxyacyl-[acyl-carrier-protein] dehydratase FabZ [Phycisphaerae bacterium]